MHIVSNVTISKQTHIYTAAATNLPHLRASCCTCTCGGACSFIHAVVSQSPHGSPPVAVDDDDGDMVLAREQLILYEVLFLLFAVAPLLPAEWGHISVCCSTPAPRRMGPYLLVIVVACVRIGVEDDNETTAAILVEY